LFRLIVIFEHCGTIDKAFCFEMFCNTRTKGQSLIAPPCTNSYSSFKLGTFCVRPGLLFFGTIETDGFGLIILLQSLKTWLEESNECAPGVLQRYRILKINPSW
jgi:hypothetical protein